MISKNVRIEEILECQNKNVRIKDRKISISDKYYYYL